VFGPKFKFIYSTLSLPLPTWMCTPHWEL